MCACAVTYSSHGARAAISREAEQSDHVGDSRITDSDSVHCLVLITCASLPNMSNIMYAAPVQVHVCHMCLQGFSRRRFGVVSPGSEETTHIWRLNGRIISVLMSTWNCTHILLEISSLSQFAGGSTTVTMHIPVMISIALLLIAKVLMGITL